LWALTQAAQIETAFIDFGKPWQNGTDESLNGKLRNECLTLEWFRNRVEARVGIERWRRHYNEERPLMSLGDRTPAEFKAHSEGMRNQRTGAPQAPFPILTGPQNQGI
jgi:putative transposase